MINQTILKQLINPNKDLKEIGVGMTYYLKYILILIATLSFAKDNSIVTGIISEDLRHELKTHEVILERIIKHYDKNRIITHHNVSSYYIEGYGSIFEVQRFPTSEINLFNQFGDEDTKSKTKYVWSDEKNAIVKFESKHSRDDSMQVIKMVDDYIKDIHLAVFEFFADYMSAANWTKGNENVLIHFDINLYRKIPKEYDRDMVEHIVPVALQAWISVEDLKKFYNGDLTIKQLDKKIKIEKINVNPKSYNYKILGDVMASAVKSVKAKGERPFTTYTTCFKKSDLGVLYFFVAQYNTDRPLNDVSNFFDFLFGSRENDDKKIEENVHYNNVINELKFRLIKSVGQYAHKLDDLSENQWIILLVNIGNYGNFKSRFVMKIQKKYVNQLTSDNLSFDEFRDHVQIFEEEFYNN